MRLRRRRPTWESTTMQMLYIMLSTLVKVARLALG